MPTSMPWPGRHFVDSSMMREPSTKCLPGQGMDVGIAVRDYLAAKGLDLEGEQQTKTKTALEFFSRELRGPA